MGSDVIQKRNKSLAPAGNLALLLGRPDMSLNWFQRIRTNDKTVLLLH